MNAIVPIFQNNDTIFHAQDAMAANHVSPMYFPVSLQTPNLNGAPLNNWNCVVNDDTGDVLHVHTQKYALIENQKVYSAFDEAIINSPLDTREMRVNDDMSHNGARAFREYIFPHIGIDAGNGDMSAMRIVLFNSYDGSMSFQGRIGGYRFVCANTCVMGSDILNLKVRHIGEVNIGDISDRLVGAGSAFYEESKRWAEWAKVEITLADASEIINSIPNVSVRLIDSLLANFAVARETDGSNLWTLYNVLTYWSTHSDGKSNPRFAGKQREDRIFETIQRKPFLQLANA